MNKFESVKFEGMQLSFLQKLLYIEKKKKKEKKR